MDSALIDLRRASRCECPGKLSGTEMRILESALDYFILISLCQPLEARMDGMDLSFGRLA